MEGRIVYNIATRSRPERFVKSLHSIINNSSRLKEKIDISFVVKIDDDQKDLYKGILDDEFIRYGVSHSKVHAINRDLVVQDGDIVVNLSDDQVFTYKGYDEIIRMYCGPDDFLLFPESFADSQASKGKNDRIAIMSIMGVQYYKRFNYIYHPDYTSLWADNEATEVARRLGRLKEVDIPIFEHLHPAAGKAAYDAQYKHTESFYQKDKAVYLTRKARNFDLVDINTPQ